MSTSSTPAPAGRSARPAVTWPDAGRQAAFQRWMAPLLPLHGLDLATLAPAPADGSLRRTLRLGAGDGSRRACIVMDAPPPQQDVCSFVRMAGLVAAAGLQAPQVLAADLEQGFLLLTDLGHTTVLAGLQAAQHNGDFPAADRLLRAALAALVQFQKAVPAIALPPFDAARLAQELALFPDWCVQREFGIQWTGQQQQTWQRICRLLTDSALAQPVVAVHADWVPRNLLVLDSVADGPQPTLGILGFQDAVAGPISHDLVSLLRDASIAWDEAQQLDWAVRWWQQARAAGLPVDADFGEFWRALEWMGLQRHLKMLGLFCRLKHRDSQPQHAADLPRLLAYANRVALRYGPLKPLLQLLEPMSGAKLDVGFTF